MKLRDIIRRILRQPPMRIMPAPIVQPIRRTHLKQGYRVTFDVRKERP